MSEPVPDTLVLLCRPGFEKDCGAEIIDSLARTGVAAWCRAEAGTGLVEVRSGEDWDPRSALAETRFDELVFARDWLAGRVLENLPVGDRGDPAKTVLRLLCRHLDEAHVEAHGVGERRQGVVDLHGELARGGEHEGARALGGVERGLLTEEGGGEREAEGDGLARAGLGGDEQVAAQHRGVEHRGLDGGR